MGGLKYLLFESASGYALLERDESEEIGEFTPEVLKNLAEFGKFNKLVQLKGFVPFTSAESALENINDVTEGIMNDTLKEFLLAQGIPKGKAGKPAKLQLGVSDPRLGGAIKEGTSIECVSNASVLELLRCVRLHFSKFVKGLDQGDAERAQIGLGHSFSRTKVKFNIHRSDNMIIQAIAILDQLDKDINTFSMRIKEWYSWHFPELIRVVPEIRQYVRVVNALQNKRSLLTDESQHAKITEVLDGDADLTNSIQEAARSSMGAELSEFDMANISSFSERVQSLVDTRTQLSEYLQARMHAVAPNLTALIGEQIGARLISKAGSLTNLSKAPASTVQILGAEKALFRALKTKGNTPKYGLLYHSGFISRAGAKNKGRISRYVANKCSIASRIDCFSDEMTDDFGKKMREQVEERLEFFASGKVPRKNIDVMHAVAEGLKTGHVEDEEKKKKKKRKSDAAEVDEDVEMEDTPKKKKKKDKEAKADTPGEKTKKKKSKSKE